MAYKLLDPQPAPRADDLAYDERGPGLYPGETALVIAGGAYAAVSVEPQWQENGAGVSLWGNARWIDKDGATHLSDAGQHVETNVRHTVPADMLATHPVEAVQREVLLLLIGEAVDEPLVHWSDEVRAQANIAVAVKLAKASAVPDAAALLGLDLASVKTLPAPPKAHQAASMGDPAWPPLNGDSDARGVEVEQ